MVVRTEEIMVRSVDNPTANIIATRDYINQAQRFHVSVREVGGGIWAVACCENTRLEITEVIDFAKLTIIEEKASPSEAHAS